MRRKSAKNKMIMFLCVALVFMGIGYAALQSNLNITGTAKSTGIFNVEILSITETQDSVDNGGVTTKSAVRTNENKNADFSATFTKPGDYVEYKMTVKNTGTIDAVVEMEIDDSANVKDLQNNDIFLFEVIDDSTGHKIKKETIQNMILESGGSRVFTVKMSYNVNATEFPSDSVTFTVTTDVTQKGTRTITNLIEDEEEEALDFTLDSNGNIIAYNKSKVINGSGYVVVGATNEKGNPITGITSDSFTDTPNTYAIQDKNEMAILILYEKGSSEYNKIKSIINAMGIEEEPEASGTNSNRQNIRKKKLKDKIDSKIKKIEDSMYAKFYGLNEIEIPEMSEEVYVEGIYIDPATGEIIEGPSVEKLDLTNATNLRTIGESAFENSPLESIKFPTNGVLTTIGNSAFRDCQLDGTITIPSSMSNIGDSAFAYNQLSTLSFQNNSGMQTIGESAFNRNQLSGILTIPTSVTSIGDSAFRENQISRIEFGNNSHIQMIGNYAFENNQLNGTLAIPNSVTIIGNYAFNGSSDGSTNRISILDLTNATNLQTIGYSAFQSNRISGTLTIPLSVTSIGSAAFSFNGTLTNLVIPNSVASIGDGAFNSTSIQALEIDMTNIPSEVFSSNGIQTLIIGNHVQEIGASAFSNNPISGTLTIPSSVTSIGNSAFNGNSDGSTNKISSLVFESNSNLQTIGEFAFSGNQISGTLTIPSSVISIGDSAFYGNSNGSTNHISSLVFENNSQLQTIGNQAFSYNQLSGTLTIPSSVTSIGDNAFHVNKLSELDLSKAINLKTIGSYAFESNQISGTLTIPSSVTSIGEWAFGVSENASVNKISSLVFESNSHLQTIGDSAFYSNQISGTLTIPSSVTSIGEYAFSGNQLSGTLTIPSSVTSIGDYAFYGNSDGSTNKISSLVFESNSNLQTIGGGAFSYNQLSGILTIPSSVTSIGYNAFNGNSDGSTNKISSLVFESNINLQTIGEDAFSGNQLSGTLTIPSSVTSIENGAFFGNQISSLVFENNSHLQTIGGSAFSYNQLSGTLTIPSSVTSIGNEAFYYNKINTLNIGSGLMSLGNDVFKSNYYNAEPTMQTINIDMTESTWNSRGLPTSGWYDGDITPTYKQE